ncbi:flagellar biosynthesis protein FlgN [uncultured Tateyamaria sp.]|uniref:flagellar biosynthesis protein FlgN n=1 Tax=uncultured Tateyamaria sp. TaxID=455651 RepID=UPI00261AA38A|nr:flagellar biosynthesis protein FlgN [uncultured Tateyamaria sp.]
MKHDEFQIAFDELHDLLDTERAALLNGNLNEVSRLFDRKSRLIDELGDLTAADTEFVVTLRTKLERNQTLLDSAADGIRSVAGRLSAVKRVRESLETYDARGKRTTFDLKPVGSLEKRA